MVSVRPAAGRLYLKLRRGAAWLLFERRYGLKTNGVVTLEELGLEHPDRIPYSATGWRTLQRILPESEVSPEEVFVDLGSGMGRAVFLAAGYPFRRVIGVEIAPQLHEIAEQNVRENRDRLVCKDVQLVNADATEYDLPDNVTVVFMFNPFGGALFGSVMDKIFSSLDRAPAGSGSSTRIQSRKCRCWQPAARGWSARCATRARRARRPHGASASTSWLRPAGSARAVAQSFS